MGMVPFEQFLNATNRGLSHFGKCLPILLRFALLLMFVWYSVELYQSTNHIPPKVFLSIVSGLVVLTFVLVIGLTCLKYLRGNDAPPQAMTPLWPFLLMNLLMILVVAAIGKWDRDPGLLGFTQHWVQRIGELLTGGGK